MLNVLDYNYHDSIVQNIEIGPRKEIFLEIRLDPIWNGNNNIVVKLHISSIEAIELVRNKIKKLMPNHLINKIHINVDGVITMEFEGMNPIKILKAKVNELINDE